MKNLFYNILILLLILSIIGVMIYVAVKVDENNNIVVKTGKKDQMDKEIYILRLKQRLARLEKKIQDAERNENPLTADEIKEEEEKIDREKILDDLILESCMVHLARDAKLDKDIIYEEAVRRLLVNRAREKYLRPKLERANHVSDETIEDYYNQNISKFTKEEKLRVAIIRQKLEEGHSAKDYQDAYQNVSKAYLEVKKAIKDKKLPASKGFGKIAEEYSDDELSKHINGKIDWIHPGMPDDYDLPNELIKRIYALKERGDMSKLIVTTKGIYIVRLVDIEEETIEDIERVRRRIKRKIVTHRHSEIIKEFYEDVEEYYKSIVNRELFSDVKKFSYEDLTQSEINNGYKDFVGRALKMPKRPKRELEDAIKILEKDEEDGHIFTNY